MLGLSRALLTLLIALVASLFVGVAWAEPAMDRSFCVRWANTGSTTHIHCVHFAVGTGGTILATRDGGTHWEPQDSETDNLASVNGCAFRAGVRGGSGHRHRLAADECRFCCGDMVGGLFYDNHPAGTRLVSGVTFGRIAGRNAAAADSRAETENQHD